MRVLLVEDEPKLNVFVKKGLEQQGYVVDSVANGSEALHLAATEQYDVIILDLMLPGINGFDVLDNLNRFKVNAPVMIMSAMNSTDRIIEGLDKGAVDYIKKPFDFGEFLARIRVVTRKGNSRHVTRYRVGKLDMDLLARKVYFATTEIILTRREFLLLELLVSNANRIVSKTEIAEKVWEVNFDMGSNVIEVHLSQLRKKLGDIELIQTKVGVGYYIEGELIRN